MKLMLSDPGGSGRHWKEWLTYGSYWPFSRQSKTIPQYLRRLFNAPNEINRFSLLISNEQLPILQDMYNVAESQSIDYGVLKKAKGVYVLPVNIGWNYVGSWDSVELSSLENKNILQIDSKYIAKSDKFIAAIGINNITL